MSCVEYLHMVISFANIQDFSEVQECLTKLKAVYLGWQ